jgi:uncharacterized delta-60 repeat protein
MKAQVRPTLAALAFALGAFLQPCLGSPGHLDMTFDPAPIATDVIFDLALQAGKLLVSGNIAGPGVSRLQADGRLDPTFQGAPSARVLCVVPDGRILLGGDFDSSPAFPRRYLARLQPDGSLDESFAQGAGPDGSVGAIAVRPDGKVIISGAFGSYDGVARPGLAQLNPNGSLDDGFNPEGGMTIGTDRATAGSLALQADGKLLVAGDFTHANGVPRSRVARLDLNGALDPSFDPGTGPNETVYCIALQADGKVVVGGWFTAVRGVARGRIARLHADGSLDGSFPAGTGIDSEYGVVSAVLVQADGGVVAGGWFRSVNGCPRQSLVRFAADGSLDATFDVAVSGEGSQVGRILQQADGKLLIAGDFDEVMGSPRLRLARLNPSAATSASPIVLYTDATRRTNGLVGSYVNACLRSYSPQNDWRVTQAIAGRRVDSPIWFTSDGWGGRAAVGLTSGTDANWDYFSVQWDGYLEVIEPGTRLATRSDDGSRLWIDLNQDGIFASSGPEFLNNHWGGWQAATTGPISQPLAPGFYRIRMQYEEGNGANAMSLLVNPIGPVDKPSVRVAYMIPSNRLAQASAVPRLQQAMLMFQNWYREEMERNGFGPKTFALETGDDFVTPKVHVVHVPETDAYLRGDVWGRTQAAAGAAGVPLWATNQVWFVVVECHLENPDGSIVGGMCGGTGGGSGSDGGVGMLGSDGLARFSFLTDNRNYAGVILPEIGPYPLVQDQSFPWFEGTTLSSVASSIMGAALHEFSHGFALMHMARNDENFHGNLMGNGLRGIRGYFYPNLYPSDFTRLSYPSALALNTSRYFNPDRTFNDNTRPAASVLMSGTVPLSNGLLRVAFSASDSGGLAAALLGDESAILEAMPLQGVSANTAFLTPIFRVGETNHLYLFVYDLQGNRQAVEAFLVPASGSNRAPQPSLKIIPPTPAVGQSVTLRADPSSDPDDGSSSLQVEWDLNGDGVFETAPSTTKTLVTNFAAAGVWTIGARLTDPAGASALAVPVALRVSEPDAVGPALTVAWPWDLAYVTNDTVTLSGTATDDAGVLWVTVNGQLAGTTSDFVNWGSSLGALTVGTNELTVVTCDRAVPPNLSTNVHRIVYAAGTFDGDGDALPDVWELQCFGAVDSSSGAPGADPDGDGLTNAAEWQAGTNPTDATSGFRLEPAARTGPALRLRFRTVLGKSYCVECKNDLDAPSWDVATPQITGDGTIMEWTDAWAPEPGRRFYRIRLLP